MRLSISFKIAIGFFELMTQCSAYALDKSCQGEDATNVKAAAAEGVKVLQYAQDRIRWQFANTPPAPYDGTLIQDMMGGNDATTWSNAKTWFSVAVNNLGSYSDTEDGKLLIYCSDDHLTSINVNTGQFRDQSRPGTTFTLKQGMNKACGGGYQAFGYPIGTDPKKGSGQPYYAIVLCKGPPGSNGPALNSKTTNLAAMQLDGTVMDNLYVMSPAVTLTGKIIHEFMHVASPQQFPLKFPDGSGEVYFYDNIAKKDNQGNYVMSKENKLRNADSFALVATALYARRYYVVNGKFVLLPNNHQVPAYIPSDIGPQPGQAPSSDSPPDSGPDTPPNHRARGLGRSMRLLKS